MKVQNIVVSWQFINHPQVHLKEFIVHQWLELIRSRYWKESLATTFFAIISIFLFTVFTSKALPGIMWQINPNHDIVETFSGGLLYYFSIEFLIRLFFQSLPGIQVLPYYHLNIKRSSLVHFLLLKSLGTSFNLFIPLITIPFGIECMLTKGDELKFFVWCIPLLSGVFFTHYLAYIVKRSFGSTLIGTLISVGIVALVWYFGMSGYVDVKAISLFLFYKGWISALIVLSLAAALYGFCFILQIQKLYVLDQQENRGITNRFDSIFNSFQTGSLIHQLIINDLKLIIRNGRPRVILIMGLVAIPMAYGFMFLPNALSVSRVQFMIMACIVLAMSYAQLMPRWESSYFDGILARPISFTVFLRAKFRLLDILVLICFIPMAGTFFIDRLYFLGCITASLYAAGIMSIGYIGISSNHDERFDLNGSAFYTAGFSGKQFFVSLIIVGVPIGLFVPFNLLGLPEYGCLVIITISLTGFLFRHKFIREFEAKYKERKYKMLTGFRGK